MCLPEVWHGRHPQRPVTTKIYVANTGSTTVTMMDGATNATTTVSAGTEPVGLAVNPATNRIYVANYVDKPPSP